jgi:hypothetical protein
LTRVRGLQTGVHGLQTGVRGLQTDIRGLQTGERGEQTREYGYNPRMPTLPKLRVWDEAGHPCRGRYLVTERGEPFFYLGDTAWELFHRLTREEADLYLKDRAAKGFTVIQAVVLAELDGLNTPNAYGDTPLHRNDPTQPNEAYFRHVDWVIDRANALGLYVGLLPTWGDKVNKKWGVGPEIFTPENARVYGEFLGKRYRDKGIVWILGGDRPVETEAHLSIWRAMAAGLRAGDDGAHLMTYHPVGGQSSAERLHAEPWLDFNMLQSGHARRAEANYAMLARDYARMPVKPCMDGEPCYEDHPIGFDPRNGWFDAAMCGARRTGRCWQGRTGTPTAATTSGRCTRPTSTPPSRTRGGRGKSR